jgi:two-component system, cell cycle response regulator DivK
MQYKFRTSSIVATLNRAFHEACSHTAKSTVLVVDSNIDNLDLTAKLLDSYGCTVITAIDGKAALTLVKEVQPALIITELMLPKIDGINLSWLLRQSGNFVPIVALTSLSSDLFGDQALQAGFNEYIEKPFQFEALENVLTRYLNLPPSPF